MELNWYSVIAQAVNFIILIWLLKKFLYTPIVKALESREKNLSLKFAEAEQNKQEAEKEKLALRKEREELNQEREKLLGEARHDADLEKAALLQVAKEDLEGKKERWQSALNQEQQLFLERFRRNTAGQVFSIAKKALADLAACSVEQAMTDAVLSRFEGCSDEKDLELFKDAVREQGSVVVCTGLPISEEEQPQILQAVKNVFGEKVGCNFAAEPDLVCGVELRVEGHVLAWNVNRYLEDLEAQVEGSLAVQNF